MNTGLAEVTLPMDFRLKNIERTQAAIGAIQESREVTERETLSLRGIKTSDEE